MTRKRSFWTVVEQIETFIQSERYTKGTRLPAERDLAARFGVSRPTIREAIIALEVRGRVEVKSNAGVYVCENPTSSLVSQQVSAFELTQARALVEGEAAALAAKSITEEELVVLADTLKAMENESDASSADRQFHLTIAKATRNEAIVRTVSYLWDIRDRQPHIVEAYQSVCCTGSVHRIDEHNAIYEALVKGDDAHARLAMHNHFERLISALFDISERLALDEVKRKAQEDRGRFSIPHLAATGHSHS